MNLQDSNLPGGHSTQAARSGCTWALESEGEPNSILPPAHTGPEAQGEEHLALEYKWRGSAGLGKRRMGWGDSRGGQSRPN